MTNAQRRILLVCQMGDLAMNLIDDLKEQQEDEETSSKQADEIPYICAQIEDDLCPLLRGLWGYVEKLDKLA